MQVSILVIMVRHFQEEGSPAMPDLPKAVKVWLNDCDESDENEDDVAGDLAEAGDDMFDVDDDSFDESNADEKDGVPGDLVEAGDEEREPAIWEAGCQLDGQRWAWQKVDGSSKCHLC